MQAPIAEDHKDSSKMTKILTKRHAGRQSKSSKKYTCNVCFKDYAHKKHLGRHYKIHTGSRPFLCNICLGTFARSDSMKRHYKTCLAKYQATGKVQACKRVPTYNSEVNGPIISANYNDQTSYPSILSSSSASTSSQPHQSSSPASTTFDEVPTWSTISSPENEFKPINDKENAIKNYPDETTISTNHHFHPNKTRMLDQSEDYSLYYSLPYFEHNNYEPDNMAAISFGF